MRHDCANNDGDEDPGDYQKAAQELKRGQRPVGEEHDEAAYPCADNVAYKYMPSLHHKRRVENCVHGDCLSANDL